MGFNGTTHFKPGELIATFESTGARLGPHVNAQTGFDDTIYMFQLPTDKAGIVEKGHAGAGRFCRRHDARPQGDRQGARRRDRRVARRPRRRLAAARSADSGPLLPSRSTPNACRSASPRSSRLSRRSELRAFYTKWYRPDRMAVVAVGDMDPAALEALDQDASSARSRSRPACAAERELSGAAARRKCWSRWRPIPRPRSRRCRSCASVRAPAEDSVGDYRRSLVSSLVSQMLNDRFDEISRKPDAPFPRRRRLRRRSAPTVDTFTLAASVQDGKIERRPGRRSRSRPIASSSTASAPASSSARRSGCSRATTAPTPSATRPRAARTCRSTSTTSCKGEPTPGHRRTSTARAGAACPAITAAEVAAARKAVSPTRAASSSAVSPQKADVKIPTEAQLQAAVTAADAVAVTPWTRHGSDRALIEQAPDPGTVVDRRGDSRARRDGRASSSNGVEAWLKPTDFKNDQVLFSLLASGGSVAAAPGRSIVEAQLATGQVELSGAGGPSRHRSAEADWPASSRRPSPFISLSSHGIQRVEHAGEPRDRAAAAQHQVHAPGDDPEAFALIKRQLEACRRQPLEQPGARSSATSSSRSIR